MHANVNPDEIGPGAVVNVEQGSKSHMGVSVTEQDGGYVGVDEDGTVLTFTDEDVTFVALAKR